MAHTRARMDACIRVISKTTKNTGKVDMRAVMALTLVPMPMAKNTAEVLKDGRVGGWWVGGYIDGWVGGWVFG